jgi:serine/threonine protein kinase
MVTLYDGKPVPKVIDFGVAKATEQRLTERTLFTQYGTLVGTLEYMSPEQAEMSALGVDTRSDIFSLGVLLYELLTGSTPLTRKRLKEAAYAEVLRIIKEEEAPKPSTRLSESGEALASISALRQTEPAKLSKLMRGELDWIVMKTLEKDRNRRYETASAFAADVERYLADEPVQACPPSAGYRLRKFARRNKAALATATLVFVLLVLGIVVSTWQAIRATRAEQLAEARLQSETEAHHETEAQRKVAESQRTEAEKMRNQAETNFLRPARPWTTCTPRWPKSGSPSSQGWSRCSASSCKNRCAFTKNRPDKPVPILASVLRRRGLSVGWPRFNFASARGLRPNQPACGPSTSWRSWPKSSRLCPSIDKSWPILCTRWGVSLPALAGIPKGKKSIVERWPSRKSSWPTSPQSPSTAATSAEAIGI